MAKNEDPFEFRGFYGCVFRAERSDFRGGVTIIIPRPWRMRSEDDTDILAWLAHDTIEMIATHQKDVAPHLTNFEGYRFSGGSIPVRVNRATE